MRGISVVGEEMTGSQRDGGMGERGGRGLVAEWELGADGME